MSPFWKRGSPPVAPKSTDHGNQGEKSVPEEEKQDRTSNDDPNTWHAGAVDNLRPKPVWGGQEGQLCRGPSLVSGACQPMMARRAAAIPMRAMRAPAPMAAVACAAAPAGAGIGFKTGGAQDAANFRENIAAGKLPVPSDINFEGLCKDYYFDTSSGDAQPTTELFAPAYSLALAPDPLLAAAGPPTAAAAAAVRDAVGAALVPTGGPSPHAAQQAQQAQQVQQAQDVFLAVGLDSGLTDFKRPRLNLALLLDVSGSMDGRFDEYFYDAASGQRRRLEEAEARKTKLDVAKEVLKGMLDRLAPDDMVSISLFSDATSTPKLLGRWGDADVAGIKAGIDALHTVGSTNFQAGLDEAAAQLRRAPAVINSDPAATENRLIVLTDAQPNSGEISETGLLSRLKANASDRIFCTLVGVGLDFNTDLVEKILKCRGANYLSVHTPGEFKKRLDEEFDYMVAPLVFDLELRIDPASLGSPPVASSGAGGNSGTAGGSGGTAASGWRMVHVYGSPDSDERRLSCGGSIMRVHSLFPSPKTEEGIKGGVVLLRLAPPPGVALADAPPLRLEARYQDRSGKQYSTLRAVAVPAEVADVAASEVEGPTALYQSTGVRKAVLLARLTDALQSWLVDQWAAADREGALGPDGWNAAAVQAVQGAAIDPRPPMPARQPLDPARLHIRPGCPLLPPGQEAVEACKPSPSQRFSPWERQSRALAVGAEARAAFRQLLPWLEGEVAALGDASLEQETDLLRKLAGSGNS